MKRKLILRFILISIAAFACVVIWGWFNSWSEIEGLTGFESIEIVGVPMNDRQYQLVIESHARPYVYEVQQESGVVMVFGAEHTIDPKSKTIVQIESCWNEFRPSIALVESRLGFLPPFVANPVRQFGEPGFVYQLALKENVPAYSWELPLDVEIAAATKKHSREQALLFFTLRPYFGNIRHGRPSNPEEVVDGHLASRSKWPGFRNVIKDVAQIDTIWQRDFPNTDWRDETDQDGLPGYLATIAEDIGQQRDVHLVQLIVGLVRNDERVFVIAGSGHAVKIERAVRDTLNSAPSAKKSADNIQRPATKL